MCVCVSKCDVGTPTVRCHMPNFGCCVTESTYFSILSTRAAHCNLLYSSAVTVFGILAIYEVSRDKVPRSADFTLGLQCLPKRFVFGHLKFVLFPNYVVSRICFVIWKIYGMMTVLN